MNWKIKTLGIVMLIGVAAIAIMLYNFPIAILAGNGTLKWEEAATLFLLAGSSITLLGMKELREKNRVTAFKFFVATLSITMVVGLFYKFWTFIPPRYVFMLLGLNGLIGMCSLPLSRYLDRREATRHDTPKVR